MSTFTTLVNIVLEVLAISIKQNEIKDMWIRKEEIKLSLFVDDMIVYIENSKQSTKKKKKARITEFSKVVRYKINMEKSVVFLYIVSEHVDTQKYITIYNHPTYKGILRCESNKHVWDLNAENYKTLMKIKT